jgi:hypothetical protein
MRKPEKQKHLSAQAGRRKGRQRRARRYGLHPNASLNGGGNKSMTRIETVGVPASRQRDALAVANRARARRFFSSLCSWLVVGVVMA